MRLSWLINFLMMVSRVASLVLRQSTTDLRQVGEKPTSFDLLKSSPAVSYQEAASVSRLRYRILGSNIQDPLYALYIYLSCIQSFFLLVLFLLSKDMDTARYHLLPYGIIGIHTLVLSLCKAQSAQLIQTRFLLPFRRMSCVARAIPTSLSGPIRAEVVQTSMAACIVMALAAHT